MAIREFRAALAQHLSDSPDAAGLIRKHDKNLAEADFSCPGHSRHGCQMAIARF